MMYCLDTTCVMSFGNVQVPSNVACRNNSAPQVQLSGCADFCIRFLLIHDRVDFGITRASSLVLTIFVYTRPPLPLIIYCHRIYPRIP
jgi:hypothetical protein